MNHLSPPELEEEIQGSWVACIYAVKIHHLFMDRVAKRFLTNTDGIYALVLHIDSWPEKHGVKKDIGIIPIHDVICGPILSMFLSTLR